MNIFEAFSYGFMQRALVAGCFIAVLCSTLGVFLVLRRFSLIGDGLAHVTFGSVAIGLLMRANPIYTSIPIVMLSSLGILRLAEKTKVYGDTAIGIVSSMGIAVGMILVSLSGGFNVDLLSFLFGSILAIDAADVYTSVILSVIVIVMVVLFYNELVSITFDEEFAKVSGIKAHSINTILILMTALTVVLAMKVVGIMLVSAMLIIPAASALQVAKSFKMSIIIAAVIGVFSVFFGIWISYILNIPPGGAIIVINFIILMLTLAYKAIWPDKEKIPVKVEAAN